jgi:hypothetical protein
MALAKSWHRKHLLSIKLMAGVEMANTGKKVMSGRRLLPGEEQGLSGSGSGENQ